MSCARAPFLAALVALSAGCAASGDEVRPPSDQFYFPTGMDITPDGSVLLVANANTDLRYDSGTVQVVDLDRVEELIGEWLASKEVPAGTDCDEDLMVPDTLVCDEREAIRVDASVRVGNFATELKIQTLDDPNALRLFLAVRGDPSLTWIDYDVSERALSCGGDGGFSECDDMHRLVQLSSDPNMTPLPDEPFGVFVDSENGYVVVTHISNGAVSLATAPRRRGIPLLSDAVPNLFVPDQFGQRGSVGAAGRNPGTAGDRIYVTSRFDSRVQTLVVAPGSRGNMVLVPTEFFFMNRAVNPATDGRSIAFSADGDRAYIINRVPPMLHIIDTSLDAQGVPKNQFIAGVELCPQAAGMEVIPADPVSGRGERVFVACFGNGQVWSIDPFGAVVDAIIDVGRGPQALVAALAPDHRRLYVSNNLESTIAVIDLTPAPLSATENRVVFRLGRPQLVGEAVQ